MDFLGHEYQRYAIDRVVRDEVVLLLLDMGLGKTVITLTAIEQLMYDTFEVKKCLVIAPLRVAEDTWSRESEKWNHLKGLRVVRALGSERKRVAALMEMADVYIINRENVEWLVEFYGKRWPFDMVVVDELSSFKNSSSRRFKALKKVRGCIKRFVGLTGTPTPNGLLDLWSQVYLADGGQRLGRTITNYRDVFFSPGNRNGHIVYEWRLKQGSEQAIYDRIGDIAVSMKAKDWLQVPERIDVIVPVQLGEVERAKYVQLVREKVLNEVEGDVVASNGAVLSGKLLQLSNGAIYDDNGGVLHVHDKKLDALEDIIEAANGKPILLFYNFKHDVERILARFESYRPKELKTSEDIKDWNEGRIKLLLAHPASAGHGLNLQAGGNTIVWFGLTWSLELYQQANARLHRQGQTEIVTVHHIVAEKTIDDDVMAALQSKDVRQEQLLEAVKAKLKEVSQ